MSYNPTTQTLAVKHYSLGIIDILCLNLPNGDIAPIFNKDIFKVLSEHNSSLSSSTLRPFRHTIINALYKGNAVSVEIGLLTGFAAKTRSGWFSGDQEPSMKRVEERYVTHWTPLKDAEGNIGYVVMTIAPKD